MKPCQDSIIELEATKTKKLFGVVRPDFMYSYAAHWLTLACSTFGNGMGRDDQTQHAGKLSIGCQHFLMQLCFAMHRKRVVHGG